MESCVKPLHSTLSPVWWPNWSLTIQSCLRAGDAIHIDLLSTGERDFRETSGNLRPFQNTVKDLCRVG